MSATKCPSCNKKHTKACIDGGRCMFCGTSLSSVTEPLTKKKPTWKRIDDSKIRHIWSWPDGSHETPIDPSFYADAGTPVCSGDDADEAGCDGDDMIYLRTEILS